jgi:hypothetical protein
MMIDLVAVAAAILITLHAPGRQQVEVNPDAIVSMRKPHEHNEDYLREGTQCVLSMSNSKLISVVESCDVVRATIEHRRGG